MANRVARSTPAPRAISRAGADRRRRQRRRARRGAAYGLGRGPHVLGRNVVVAGGCDPPSDWDGLRTDPDRRGRRARAPADRRASANRRLRTARRRDRADRRHRAASRRAPTGPRVGCAIRVRRRRAAPPRVVELRRRARSRRAEVVARRSGRGARRRVRRRRRRRAPRRHGRVARRRAGPLHRSGRRTSRCCTASPSSTGRSRRPCPNVSGADLAADQLAAVAHAGGAARIIAPAGSGKTRVLTERARHLLVGWRLPPSAVSLVAFNKRAQEEMRERTADLPGLQVRTLNAIALAIVNGVPPFLAQASVVAHDRRARGPPRALEADRLPEAAQHRSGGAVDRGARARSGSGWSTRSTSNGGTAATSTASPRCGRGTAPSSNVSGAVDFDDQIYRAIEVLLDQPDARAAAQRACRLMLVDEFQDLTPAHLLLVRLLAGARRRGVRRRRRRPDDLRLQRRRSGLADRLRRRCSPVPATIRSRSTTAARPASSSRSTGCCATTAAGSPKTIRAAAVEPGGWSVDTSDDPVRSTAAAVEAVLGAGGAPADVAVLTRVNASLAPVQLALVAAGVPVAGGVGLEFADRTSVRAVLAWLRLATGRRRVRRPTTSPRRCVARRARCTRGSPSGSPSRATSPACDGSRRGSTPNATPSGWRVSPTTSSGCSELAERRGIDRARSSTSCSTTIRPGRRRADARRNAPRA